MRVALFVPCLVDQWFPSVGEATVTVLERAGCEVDYPRDQTCCGQPAFNAGHADEARAVAEHFLDVFGAGGAIVTPSGSCASMVRRFYSTLFDAESALGKRAAAVAARTFELSEFLVNQLHLAKWPGASRSKIAYHDSCHLRRELGITAEPRQLLASVRGTELIELAAADRCCGFGGLFSVKYPELSTAILDEKIADVTGTGADLVVTSDAGCMAQIAGGLARRGSSLTVLHFAEYLARSLDGGG